MMPGYKIIGDDLKEYGPVTPEQIRQWIAEGRVNSQTKVQAEGGGEWKEVADIPELAVAPPSASASVCPKCGEPFEPGFDSCWKCGTGKDGSPPKWTKPVEVDANEVEVESAGTCPKCGSLNVSQGQLLPTGRGMSVIFRPEGTPFFTLSFWGGVSLSSDASFACLDCGLVWDHVRPGALKEFIRIHCRGSAK
jgi:predicted nucleic-acid-binding Zn-ribbon protein